MDTPKSTKRISRKPPAKNNIPKKLIISEVIKCITDADPEMTNETVLNAIASHILDELGPIKISINDLQKIINSTKNEIRKKYDEGVNAIVNVIKGINDHQQFDDNSEDNKSNDEQSDNNKSSSDNNKSSSESNSNESEDGEDNENNENQKDKGTRLNKLIKIRQRLLKEKQSCEDQKYVSCIERYKSFKTWVGNVDPQLLTKAGFYLTNRKCDTVRCFFCGIQLKDWDIYDDPFEEHYKWNSECQFINSVYLPKKVIEQCENSSDDESNTNNKNNNDMKKSLAYLFRTMADKIAEF